MDQSTTLDALAALAQESRLAVFRLLVKAGPEGLAAGEIADRVADVDRSVRTHVATPSSFKNKIRSLTNTGEAE